MLVGEPVMVVDGFRYLERDGRLLGVVSTGLLVLTIIVLFPQHPLGDRSVGGCATGALLTQAVLVVSRPTALNGQLDVDSHRDDRRCRHDSTLHRAVSRPAAQGLSPPEALRKRLPCWLAQFFGPSQPTLWVLGRC